MSTKAENLTATTMENIPSSPLARPELLAPAGDWECAKAAVENGADAIYFGLERFNARMRAHNFTDADLPKLMEFLHRRGVKGYVTFNTLIFANELAEAEQHLRAIIAAGVAMGWSDDEMRQRYRRSFVDTNPVNDYTFPLIALTRGRKVTRLLQNEYGDTHIEDLRQPFFCISANLTTGSAFEHRAGPLAQALRASVAIPGVMPPVFRGDHILVDGATINNLPVDVMQRHAPGLVIGSDVGADNAHNGKRRLTIFRILMYSGLVNSAASAAAQRKLADVLLRPPLANVDLLNWQAFDRAIEAGYTYARRTLDELPDLPRCATVRIAGHGLSSLEAELDRRVAATAAAGEPV